jgi:LmbE family N-acetylglucosaminyl deacetylase
MQFNKSNADFYVPDGAAEAQALGRTTDLGITAHQDDIEIAMYSAIADCYNQSDKWFTGVVVTNGAGSPRTGIYADFSNEEMMAVRHKEQRQAAFVGDYSAMIQLMYSSSEVKDSANQQPVEDIKAILEAAQPDNVYLHNPADKHDTHIATFARSLAAIRQLPKEQRPKKVYGCEVWRALDWMNDDEKLALDVDRFPNVAAAVLGVFDSQISGGKRYDLATAGRRLANATYFASHATDESEGLTYAIDLTPLVEDDGLDVAEYVNGFIENFKRDVNAKIAKFS